jgi:hypothetical protein
MMYLTDERLLRERYGALLDLFERTPECADCSFMPSQSGHLTARVQTDGGLRFLHSAVDPYIEANTFVNSALMHERGIPLIVGFGLGYHLEELYARHATFERVIVFEPRADILKEACVRRDLAKLFAHGNLTILTGFDDAQAVAHLAQLVSDPALSERLSIVVHKPSLNLYEHAYPRFVDVLQKTVTDLAAAHLMRDNALANLDAVKRAEGIAAYAGRYTGKTCAVVAAGPSLSQTLSYLRDNRAALTVIAVTTAVKPLLAAGIKPDFIVLADQQRIMRTHLDGIDVSTIPMLFLPTASHDAVAAYAGPLVVALQHGYPLCDELEAAWHKGRLQVGGSVVTVALGFALQCGFARVEFAGLDLAYADGYSHADGVEKRAPVAATETVMSVRGTLSPTTNPMLSFKTWIEVSIASHPEVVFVNLSPCGARIAGTLAGDMG